jgi:RNA polymerase sigma-70 factor (ECF subfamily)
MDNDEAAGLLRQALAGDQRALTRLVSKLTPVIQARVARTLLSRRSLLAGGRSVRQEVEDQTQEIFLSLFSRDSRVLRSWHAERGLGLESFVGLVAERHIVSFLRSGKRNPTKEDSFLEDLEPATLDSGPEEVTASREELRLLLDRMREELSPLGRQLFELLFVQELTLPEVTAASGLSADAVYAWRSRLRRLAQRLLAELSGSAGAERRTWKDGKA